MREYLKRFWLLYVAIIVLLLFYLAASGVKRFTLLERTNDDCGTQERVFDYADILTDDEERSLRELIAQREKQTGCDIVLVLMKEKLEPDYSIRDYADDFYDGYQFGYNKPVGDGVILVCNWYNDGSYTGEVWLSTCGKAEYAYTDGRIDRLLDDVCEVVNNHPYKAYERYVNRVYKDMAGSGLGFEIQEGTICIIALFAAGLYLFWGISGHKGKKSTSADTYVANGISQMNQSDDVFITKRLTSRRIKSSSGGGGHHRSRGGHSHGGGGRRH